MTRKKRLGRGLEALLNSSGEAVAEVPVEMASPAQVAEPPAPRTPEEGDIVQLSVYDIEDNPYQPRRVFTESEIVSLAESLKEHDILQPILVRVVEGRYQLISGERRLRAAIKANWETIPARIRTADDRLVSELAIVENLQRKDLNPIEKALSFRRYIDEHQCTQEELANRLKIDRSTVTNLMRLLDLPPQIKDALQSGLISMGHARTLLPLAQEPIQLKFCQQVIDEGLSVRATERAVSEFLNGPGDPAATGKPRAASRRTPQVEALEQALKQALGTKVVIKPGTRNKGQIVVHFANGDEFERLHRLLSGGESQRRAG